MKKYIGAVQNNRPSKTTGNAAVNATVTVRDARDGSKASLYDDDFVTSISNPVMTDNNGKYYFSVQDGIYNIVINEGLPTEVTNRNVYIFGDADIHFQTEAEFLASRVPVGKYVTVGELGDAPFLIEPVGSTLNPGGKTIANNNVANIDKSQGFVKPEWYGAKGDNLTDDYTAIQNAINDNLANGQQIRFTSAYYRVSQQIDIDNSVNLTLIGESSIIAANFTTDERILGGEDVDGLVVDGLTFDQRYSVTGYGVHIVSMLNPRNCEFRNCSFVDFEAFAVIMFTDDRGLSGVAKNNHIINCRADGNNTAYGGFGMESMIDSSINGVVTRIYGSDPAFPVNLKNNCNNCTTDVIVSDSLAGIVLSDDGPSTVGNGVKNSFIKGTVNNCKFGATFNKCENVHADLNINGGGISGGLGVGIYGFNKNCDYDISLANCDPAGYAITSRSNDQRINVRRYDMSGNKLLLLEPGTDRNRLVVGFTDITANGPNIVNYVDDDASNLNNEVVYMRDAPSSVNSGGAYSAQVVFPIYGDNRTDNLIAVSDNGLVTFRTAAANQFYIDPANAVVGPAVDNTMSSASAARRWSQIYAANGTINTSDQREKQQIRSLTATELTVATQCKLAIKAFKWNEAVEKKGDDGARWHFGWIAQEIKGIFESNGLDPFKYGVVCYDEWQDNGGGNRYGIRKDELVAFIISVL